ncbi:hypothetical protein [Undibacterium sp. KW1]|uniref:hypothetical protein n=1 Tax=Undibacterium sp. KW1 TaxID=2058624 RepID=UPI001389C060|nr:hypothetical protein [Undibacterium sp. KW1]
MNNANALQSAVNLRLQSYVVTTLGSITRTSNAVTQTSSLALETFQSAQLQVEDKLREAVFQQATQRNTETLKAVLTLELAKNTKTTLKDWQNRLTQGDKTLWDAVLTSSPTILKAQVIDAAGGQAAVLLRGQLQSQLADALSRAQAINSMESTELQNAIGDLQKVVHDGMSIVSQTALVVNALGNSKPILAQTKEYLTSYRAAAEGLQTVGDLVARRVLNSSNFKPLEQAALKSAIQIGQQFLQGEAVSSSDVISALDRAGIPFPTKDELRNTLDRLSDLRKPDVLSKGLNDVQGYLALASSLGVKIDPSITQSIGTAQAATNIAAAYFSGNFLGAASGAMGLFGGGGGGVLGGFAGDPMLEKRFEEIKAALGEIQHLQLKTLEALDNLSKQLATSTGAIMTKLDGIQDSVEFLTAMAQFSNVNLPLSKCHRFVESAQLAGMKNGYFESYITRKTHFENYAQDVNRSYPECQKMLNDNLFITRSGNTMAPMLPPTLWDVAQVRSARKTPDNASAMWRNDREMYFPMVAYTVNALQLGKPNNPEKTEFTFREPCSTRFIGALATAPRSIHDVHYARLTCKTDDNSPANEGLRLSDTNFLPAGPLLEIPVNAPLVAELAHYSVLFQTYNALIDESGPGLKLWDEATLTKGGKLNEVRERGGRANLLAAIDTVNVAISQQTLMSGLYIIDFAADQLRNGKFGDGQPNASNELIAATSKEGCAPHKYLASEPYHVTACMLLRHPEFARNVALHLVLADTGAAALSLQEYASLFDSGEASASDVFFAFPTLSPYIVKRGRSWFIEIKSPVMFNESLLLALPSAAVLKDGTVAYPEIMRSLLVARGAILQELGDEMRTASDAKLWSRAIAPKAVFLPPAPGLTH